MNANKEANSPPPRENILRIWTAANTRRNQMRSQNFDFLEYIWLRRLCHQFVLLGFDDQEQAPEHLGAHLPSDMEELRNVTIDADLSETNSFMSGDTTPKSPLRYMSVFSFLDAIRLHKSVPEIERHRRGPTGSRNTHSLCDGGAHRPDERSVHQQQQQQHQPSDSTAVDGASPSTNEYTIAQASSHAPLATSSNNHRPAKPEFTYIYCYSDALKYAIMYGHLAYTVYLLESHLEEALLDTVCCPLLLVAVRLDHPDIVQQLCSHSRRKSSHNFYINKPGCSAMEGGRTALHVAAEVGNVQILRILLRYGADPSVKDDHGQTPLRRILYRLQSPHLTNKTIRCINELVKCQPVISASELAAISRIVLEAGTTMTDAEKPIVSQLLDLVPGPLSLKYITRIALRKVISYPHLPEGIHQINMPTSLAKFLEMGDG